MSNKFLTIRHIILILILLCAFTSYFNKEAAMSGWLLVCSVAVKRHLDVNNTSTFIKFLGFDKINIFKYICLQHST